MTIGVIKTKPIIFNGSFFIANGINSRAIISIVQKT